MFCNIVNGVVQRN
jgi:hypothetical protein